jgi:hypothetical protein
MSVPCFVTSNAHYIPALAPSLPDKLFLRQDMRYGPDDPTLWPQEYSDNFCHMGAIPRKPTTEKGKQALGIMWWNPERTDFVCPTSGMTVTRGLGKLSHRQCTRLAELVNGLLDQYKTYAASLAAPAKTIALFPQLNQNLVLGLERLQSVPSTFERMTVEVTCLQRSYLELQGLLAYMTVYKPRMEDPDAQPGLPDDCIGVFTSDPKVAQQFCAARLPYWFLRPLSTFHHENILRVVTPLDPAQFLDLEPAPGYDPISVGLNIEQRMRSLHLCTGNTPWYKNPFSLSQPSVWLPQNAVAGPSHAQGQGSNRSREPDRNTNRVSPCKQKPFFLCCWY